MNSIPSKRKRSPNWQTDDKALLISLVEEHFHIIENKKIDGVSMKTKLAEWKVMAEKFNSQTLHGARSPETLKAQWESMKKNVKKEEASLRIKTGSGPPKPRKTDPIYLRIVRLIETAAMFIPYDGDCSAPANNAAAEDSLVGNSSPEEIIDDAQQDTEVKVSVVYDLPQSESPSSENDCETPYEANDWGDWRPVLGTPISSTSTAFQPTSPTQPHTNDNQNKTTKAKTWTSRKRHLSTLQQLYTKKIEALKSHTECMAVTHKLNMELLQERLKQEKIKTKMLLLEWKLKKSIKNREGMRTSDINREIKTENEEA